MPAARLSDSQKAEVVERFRAGEGLQQLAEAYGCSPNTVSRAVKAALDPGEYDRIKERNRRSATPRMEPADPLVPALIASHGEEPAGEGEGANEGDSEGSGRAEDAALEFDRPSGATDPIVSPVTQRVPWRPSPTTLRKAQSAGRASGPLLMPQRWTGGMNRLCSRSTTPMTSATTSPTMTWP